MQKGILGVVRGLERGDGGSAGRDLVDKEVLLKDLRGVDLATQVSRREF